MKDKKKKWTGKRAHSEEAEFKYQSISSGMARKFYMGQILQKQVRTHLQKNLRNEAETEALLRLQGGLGALAKARKWTASKEEMMRFWAVAEKERLDRKKGLTKAEAVASFAIDGPPKKLSALPRPSAFKAKPTTPYYPRKGSSRGVMKTKQKGAVKTNKAFRDFINSIFKLGGDRPNVKTKRTISKIIDE